MKCKIVSNKHYDSIKLLRQNDIYGYKNSDFFIIAKENGKFIGTSMVREKEPKHFRLSYAVIHPDYQDKGYFQIMRWMGIEPLIKEKGAVHITRVFEESFYETAHPILTSQGFKRKKTINKYENNKPTMYKYEAYVKDLNMNALNEYWNKHKEDIT